VLRIVGKYPTSVVNTKNRKEAGTILGIGEAQAIPCHELGTIRGRKNLLAALAIGFHNQAAFDRRAQQVAVVGPKRGLDEE
jgi:hypothetical protein